MNMSSSMGCLRIIGMSGIMPGGGMGAMDIIGIEPIKGGGGGGPCIDTIGPMGGIGPFGDIVPIGITPIPPPGPAVTLRGKPAAMGGPGSAGGAFDRYIGLDRESVLKRFANLPTCESV
jgi:hypothetical protein